MARRKATATKASGADVVVVTPPAPPVRRRSSSPRRRKRSRRSNYARVGGQSSSYKNRLLGTAIGGLAYGFIEKSFPQLPTIPLLGKSGTVALACYFFGGSHNIVKDVGIAAAAIAGYSLGKDGKISGDYDEHGLAAEL